MARRDEDDKSKPLYMISVAAELTGMHPQTLRVYEQKGLVTPGRSRGNTRLYSQGDIERLNLISKLTDEGINLAGVVRILDMRERAMERDKEIDRLRRRVRELEDEVHELRMREKITALARYDGAGPEQVMRGRAAHEGEDHRPRPLRRRGTGAGHARTALERQGPRRLRPGRRRVAGSSRPRGRLSLATKTGFYPGAPSPYLYAGKGRLRVWRPCGRSLAWGMHGRRGNPGEELA